MSLTPHLFMLKTAPYEIDDARAQSWALCLVSKNMRLDNCAACADVTGDSYNNAKSDAPWIVCRLSGSRDIGA